MCRKRWLEQNQGHRLIHKCKTMASQEGDKAKTESSRADTERNGYGNDWRVRRESKQGRRKKEEEEEDRACSWTVLKWLFCSYPAQRPLEGLNGRSWNAPCMGI